MNTYKYYLGILIMCCTLFSNNVFAQEREKEIVFTEEDKKQLQDRVKLKVEEFMGYLSDIVNKDLTYKQRTSSIDAALALFMGKGEPYYVTIEDTIRDEFDKIIEVSRRKEKRNAVRIQISSLSRDNIKWSKVKTYLWNQYKNIHVYDNVVIQSADVVRVDNIYQVGNNQFEAVAYFCQKYVAYRDGRRVYGPDITGKKIIVHIRAIDTPRGYTWDARFGDIYVTGTERGK